jgi:CDP-diacylglycerol--glycerol-3-phosphate 3-phosphatidyltransferase
MIAIAVLFSRGIFEHHLGMNAYGMDQEMFDQVMAGDVEDVNGLQFYSHAMVWSGRVGLWLLWIAGLLTLVTGIDYFRKSLPFLKDTP